MLHGRIRGLIVVRTAHRLETTTDTLEATSHIQPSTLSSPNEICSTDPNAEQGAITGPYTQNDTFGSLGIEYGQDAIDAEPADSYEHKIDSRMGGCRCEKAEANERIDHSELFVIELLCLLDILERWGRAAKERRGRSNRVMRSVQ